MIKHLLLGTLAASLWAGHAAAAPVTANLAQWTQAGDVTVASGTSARITTAAAESGEQPSGASSALLFYELEPALKLAGGVLPADTIEGSGLQLSFSALASTTISFAWSLSTALFDADYIDRAFVVIDGSLFESLADVALTAVNGQFSHTFGAGDHSLAFGILDVNSTDLVSTLDISGFNVSSAAEVPEPGTWALVMAGIAGLAGATRRRRA
ncbi:PEP-CTERM sorting domain-containing protein [Pseudorhodoferax sp. Leaf274]|uniref:PEP-CTERM sorting domain-containing protein n=1 Tax=Pseudorhodoferax sp. Leaf274 TaxID=1736318 RepID=UPI0007024A75|nr:PEP-CTERM sorting domain-containing protein [Pseudorhodoferax sp. Leaf274]KQP35397.1 hypothetical protein ASF44_18805 [Pseudorhodoferax sp. Leaf274]